MGGESSKWPSESTFVTVSRGVSLQVTRREGGSLGNPGKQLEGLEIWVIHERSKVFTLEVLFRPLKKQGFHFKDYFSSRES